jgi:hypothetical protein
MAQKIPSVGVPQGSAIVVNRFGEDQPYMVVLVRKSFGVCISFHR